MPGTLGAVSLDNARAEKLSLHAVQGFQVGYTMDVQAVKLGGTVYVDITSMSRALRLLSKRDGGQLSIMYSDKGTKTVCRLIEGSNFADFLPQNPGRSQRVVQLRSAPVLWKKSFWLRAVDAVRLFSLWMDREVVYDQQQGRIDAFLWSSQPGSKKSKVGIVRAEDRHIGYGPAPRYKGPTTLNALEVSELANGVVIRIKATGSKSTASFIKPGKKSTASLTLQTAKGDPSDFFRTFSQGLLKEIRAIPLGNGAMQIDISLNNEFYKVKSSEYQWDSATNTYVISIMSDIDVQAVYRAEKEKLIRQELARDLQKWKFDTIVLDAGHGGKDPGAVGKGGTREKDIVLRIVRYLGAVIKKEWPEIKVVYTRSDDRFIPLKQRGKIANRSDGKLFVSVHCNAAENRSAKGAEVYILGPHKNDAALRVAMLENAAIKQEEDYKNKYRGFSEEHTIMSSLAQNAFTLQSKEAARHVLEGMEKKTDINGRGVRQAGFMVLWTPSMPSLLVEAGYLSNPGEEKVLRQATVQRDIARGIFNGLKRYRATYEQQQVASGVGKGKEG
uniref:N-acetylmuramoyl-L-alanine amidase n=1 Tax=Chlorobium phaeobacteroides (strain BS1) TaxID=331678 RepID=B3EPW6_CHLPB